MCIDLITCDHTRDTSLGFSHISFFTANVICQMCIVPIVCHKNRKTVTSLTWHRPSNLILQACGIVANYLQGFANCRQPITISTHRNREHKSHAGLSKQITALRSTCGKDLINSLVFWRTTEVLTSFPRTNISYLFLIQSPASLLFYT